MSDRLAEKVGMHLRVEEYFKSLTPDNFRAISWYLILPTVLFFFLSPGLFFSIPPTKDCDTKEQKFVMTGRANFYNGVVHSVVFFILIAALFWGGSRHGIVFPNCSASIKQALST